MDDLKEFVNQIEYIDDETLEQMDFFDAAMYLEKLNQLDDLENGGDSNE